MANTRKLSAILIDIEKEITRCRKWIRPISSNSRRSSKRAYALHILVNYQEVVLVLKRIEATFKELADLQPRIMLGKLTENEEVKREALIGRSFDLVNLLRLDVKALYMWTALIADIFAKSGLKIDSRELERIALFRHKLITHVHDTPFFKSSLTARSGTKHNAKEELVEDSICRGIFGTKDSSG